MIIHTIHFEESFKREEILKERRVSPVPFFLNKRDDEISMNYSFDYLIAEPDDSKRAKDEKLKSFIFLFHGLNERSWEKYISWAEALVNKTGRAVILFPLAFHINRAPVEWSNPRLMNPLINEAGKNKKKHFNLSFVNFALSSRIKSDPYRFYLSGKQTIYNICQLLLQIDNGEHPLIESNAKFDIFAYSIGAFMSQVMIQANPMNRFGNSKLFMFCGGSVFCKMNGNSKLIMDKESFLILNRYYKREFLGLFKKQDKIDSIDRAFISMIGTRTFKKERKSFYLVSQERVRIVALKQDKVIPIKGIKKALGRVWEVCLEEMDFTYKYSHEAPFPLNIKEKDSREYWFNEVFTRASEFLSQQ
jgi:hypothetical protein